MKNQDTPLSVVRVDVRECMRCGAGHKSLAFKQLTRPIDKDGYGECNYWALCPANGEPILMGVNLPLGAKRE